MSRFSALRALYSFYDEFVSGFSVACRKGCHVCCTTNVSATSLETAYLLNKGNLDKALLERVEKARLQDHYVPSTTINTTAAMCLAGRAIPEETSPITFDPCPFLDDEGSCSVYEYRPFSCRAMCSSTLCTEGGQADMPPFLVTISLAVYQILEHMDSQGWYGNLLDIIPMCDVGRAEAREMADAQQGVIKTNRDVPCFIVPPDDVMRFKSFLRRLSRVEAGSTTMGEFLPEDYQILS